jgi:hypothetical protein
VTSPIDLLVRVVAGFDVLLIFVVTTSSLSVAR